MTVVLSVVEMRAGGLCADGPGAECGERLSTTEQGLSNLTKSDWSRLDTCERLESEQLNSIASPLDRTRPTTLARV